MDLQERILKIKLLMMDVDGVLTDGRIVYGDCGDELKFFDVQDGFGLSLWRRAGHRSVIVSAKKCRVNIRRARELKVDAVFQNVPDKLQVFEKALKRFRLQPEEVCFIGDDLLDAPVLLKAGLAVSVPNGVEDVKRIAHTVTQRSGGCGALRELIELLLKTQGRWDSLTASYLSPR